MFSRTLPCYASNVDNANNGLSCVQGRKDAITTAKRLGHITGKGSPRE